MADNRHDLNRDRNMDAGNRSEQRNPGQGQRTPGRDMNDDLSTGGRQGGGVQGSERKGIEDEFDREDREKEQPGSKQRDQDR